MALTGPWCLHCPLCERDERHLFTTECITSLAEIEPIVRDSRSGVKLAIRHSEIIGYAIFGRPELFPGIKRAGLPVDQDALFLAALSTTDWAREHNVHADLLIEVMTFAADHGYTQVVAAFRPDDPKSAEPAAELLEAAEFTLGKPGSSGLGLATITLKDWQDQTEIE